MLQSITETTFQKFAIIADLEGFEIDMSTASYFDYIY